MSQNKLLAEDDDDDDDARSTVASRPYLFTQLFLFSFAPNFNLIHLKISVSF